MLIEDQLRGHDHDRTWEAGLPPLRRSIEPLGLVVERRRELLAHLLLTKGARCCGRDLVDGRTATFGLAAVGFLDLDGHTVDLDDDAAFELVMAAAEGQLDVGQIAQRLAIRPS